MSCNEPRRKSRKQKDEQPKSCSDSCKPRNHAWPLGCKLLLQRHNNETYSHCTLRRCRHILIDAAIQGYQAAHKEGRLGTLLGRVQGNTAIVEHARLYRAANGPARRPIVNTDEFARRVRQLSGSALRIPWNFPFTDFFRSPLSKSG
jgi:hypothetical protein